MTIVLSSTNSLLNVSRKTRINFGISCLFRYYRCASLCTLRVNMLCIGRTHSLYIAQVQLRISGNAACLKHGRSIQSHRINGLLTETLCLHTHRSDVFATSRHGGEQMMLCAMLAGHRGRSTTRVKHCESSIPRSHNLRRYKFSISAAICSSLQEHSKIWCMENMSRSG